MLGGYQIIDFGGTALSDTPVTIKDAFKKAISGKALLLENVVFEGLNIPVNTFGCVVPEDNIAVISFTFTAITLDTPIVGNGVIVITDEDAVTGDIITLVQDS